MWTEQAYQCYKLGKMSPDGQTFVPNCSGCSIPRLRLDSVFEQAPTAVGGEPQQLKLFMPGVPDYCPGAMCHMYKALPELVQQLGEPRVFVHQGEERVYGEKEIIYNEIHREVLEIIKAEPGITLTELSQRLTIKYTLIESALKRGQANGYLKPRKVKRKGKSKSYYVNEWFFVENEPRVAGG